MNKILQKHYTDPSLPGSFGGLESFYRALGKAGFKFDKEKVREWLSGRDTYTLHHPRRNIYPRNKVIVPGIDNTWQIDLADMTNIHKDNDNFNYMLICIDVFSKFLAVEPTLNKNGKTVTDALKTIFERTKRKPKQIQSDDGKEFKNNIFQKYLKENQIRFYTTRSEQKACIVERVIRTIKERMYRYFTEISSHRYIDVIQSLVDSYNRTYHRTIKMAPKDVNKKKEKEIWKALYFSSQGFCTFKFKVNDVVRLSRPKTTFDKGYLQKWTDETFIIYERIPRSPAIYKIKDLNDEAIDGFFYEHELQKVDKVPQVFKIQEILKTRTRKGVKESLIKWRGYPDSFNSWVRSDEVVNLK